MAKSPIYLRIAPVALLGLASFVGDGAFAQTRDAVVAPAYSKATVRPEVQSPAPAPAPAANRVGRMAAPALRPNTRDESNQAIDATLAKFSARNAGNPQALTALEDAAASIKRNPADFVDANGTPNFTALAGLVRQKFSSAGPIAIPANGAQNSDDAPIIGGNPNDQDILALVFIVMMDAAKSAQEDLKSIMAGVKAINKQKEGLRHMSDTIDRLAAGCAAGQDDCGASSADKVTINHLLARQGAGQGVEPVTRQDVDAAKDAIKDKLDSKSEMGETESLRLQMAMDRVSKFMTALSNIEKKASDTDSSIIQNMK